MSAKVYTLELTAEDIATLKCGVKDKAIDAKLDALWASTRADRKADDLRLPWRVTHYGGVFKDQGWACITGTVGGSQDGVPKHIAKLMSAAPELLEAVQAVLTWQMENLAHFFDNKLGRSLTPVNEKLQRALRKVETGVPE